MKSILRFYSTSFLLIILGLVLSTKVAFADCPSTDNGPDTISVPIVTGMSQADAIDAILSAGLKVGTVSQIFNSSISDGIVYTQSPAGTTCAAPNASVAITVAYNVVVPDVVGQSQTTAAATIGGTCSSTKSPPACLTVGTITQQEDLTVPAGTVLSQTPPSGSTVNPSTTKVNLTVATGSSLVSVPNVVEQTQVAAATMIASSGLTVGIITLQASATVPAGNVISQSPAANSIVTAGTAVNLWISTGTGITVPNVVGQPQATATTTLANAGLTLGTVTQAYSATVAAGNVISQNPMANTTVTAGSAVDLVVSQGVAPVTVPSVVGQTVAAATTQLTNAKLTVGTKTLAASSTIAAGNVLSQNPPPGYQVAPGTAVNLVISSGKEAPVNPPYPSGGIAVPDVVGLTQTAAANLIHTAGLNVGATIKQYSDTIAAGLVISQSPAAGAQVAVGTFVSLTVSLGKAGVVTVPNVTDQLEATAKTTLQNVGLSPGTTLTEPSTTISAGNVIRTDPVAGTQVNIGSTVNLIVSSGFSQPQEVAVPSEVIGMTVDDARAALFAVGLFQVGTVTVKSSATIPAGRVSDLVPAAGTPVAYGTTINLFVSSGSQPPVATPNVVGLSLDAATASLNAVGLQVGLVTRQTSNTVEEGHVISQNPLMTALVPVGWPVNLVVSLGPIPEDPNARPQTTVPDVSGMTLAQATTKLITNLCPPTPPSTQSTACSLRVGLVSNQRSQDVPAGQVLRQNPPAGSTVPVGSSINLVISYGPYAYGLLSGPAYITNYVGNTVSVINPESDLVIDNIPVGISNMGPSGIAINPDGTRLYVANRSRSGRSAGSLSVIDLTERKVIAIIPVGVSPLGVAVDPTGQRVFVANEGSFSMSVIDTATNQPLVDLGIPGLSANPYPRGVAVHPNPTRPLVYVTNRTVNSVSDDAANPYPDQCDALVARPPINVNPDQCVGSLSIFDTELKAQVGSVAVGMAPEGVAVHPNGMLVYVANSGDRTISVMETIFNQVVGVITLDEFGGAPPPLVPRGVAVSTDGNRLYVTDGAGNRLFIIDIIANHAVVSIVPTGQKPYGVSASPYIGTEDGQPVYQVYVANETDNTVSVIKDGPNNQAEVIATIPVGQDPWAFGQFVGPLATVAAPTFTPPGGAYQSGVKVTISTTTSGAAIRYTTDGSTPTSTSGTLIESGQTILVTTSGVSGTVVLKAVAFKEGWADSAVTEASYQINRQF